MNTERQLPQSEVNIPSEVHQIIEADGIKDYLSFADLILEVDWGEEGPPEEYTPEFIAAHPDLTAVFVMKEGDEIIGGSKVKLVDERTKNRLGLMGETWVHQTGALLEYTAIKEDYRNKGLLKVLTDKRIEWAKDHNAEYVCTETGISESIATYVKLRDGFRIIGVCEPGEGIPEYYFVLVKLLDEAEDKVNQNVEYKEIKVDNDSVSQLSILLNEGWHGVDIKGIGVNSENLVFPYALILEKAE